MADGNLIEERVATRLLTGTFTGTLASHLKRITYKDGDRRSEGFESCCVPDLVQPVAAVPPATPDRQQTEGSAQVQCLANGPTDRMVIGWISGTAVPEPHLIRRHEDARPEHAGGYDLDVADGLLSHRPRLLM